VPYVRRERANEASKRMRGHKLRGIHEIKMNFKSALSQWIPLRTRNAAN
jgi:hypothetical protein